MSMAFEVTQHDVSHVLNSHNVEVPSDMDEVMAIIADSEIEKAALSVDIDPDDDEDYIFIKQTEAAYDEIAWQLYQAGFITEQQIDKYGNPNLLNRVE